jgi:hypothetical protein
VSEQNTNEEANPDIEPKRRGSNEEADPMAPGKSVNDETSPEAVEPNEPA